MIFFDLGAICDHRNLRFWYSRLHAVRFFEFSPCRKKYQENSKICSKLVPKPTPKPQKNHKQIHQKMHLIFERFSPPKWTKNDPQMGGKKLGKFHFGRLGRPRGAPRTPKATHWTPRTPKMEPKAPPEPPKWIPSDPQSSQKGAQASPEHPK